MDPVLALSGWAATEDRTACEDRPPFGVGARLAADPLVRSSGLLVGAREGRGPVTMRAKWAHGVTQIRCGMKRSVLCAAWTLSLGWLSACREPAAQAGPVAEVPAPCPKPLPARVQRGICFAHSYERGGERGYGSSASQHSRGELARLGVRWLSLTPYGFSRSLQDPEVRHVGSHRAGESDARVRTEIRAAHAEKLHVLLKPHVWIGSGEWIGHMHFDRADQRDAWHQSYEAWILHYAKLAASEGVEILSIGTELGLASGDEARWRRSIARIRAVYPGKLTFGANWNQAEQVPFWDALDYIGVQFYAPLESQGTVSNEVSRRAVLERYLDSYGQLAARVKRPVLFTEVGYRAITNTNLAPHAWPEHLQAAPDEHAQVLAYTRFLDAVSARDYVDGVYFWKWFTNPESSEEGRDGFSPRGKSAARVLRSAFTGQCGDPGTAR